MESSRESSPQSSPSTQRAAVNGSIVSTDPHGPIQSGRINLAFELGEQVAPSLPDDVKLSATQFLRRQRKGFIDVWWLYDDGGEN